MRIRNITLAVLGLIVATAATAVFLAASLRAMAQASAYSDPYATDPYPYEQCLAADNSGDGLIDVLDAQRAAAHYGGGIGYPYDPQRYDPRFDIQPFRAADGDIDIMDLQKVYGRFGMTCSRYTQANEYWKSHGGMYSYDAGCADGGEIDPITTVFRYAASGQQVHDDLVDIGLGVEAGSEQDFRDNGACATGEISVADDDGWSFCSSPPFICSSDRWHVRSNVVGTADPTGGFWASATPHRDVGTSCGHLTPAYIEVDGFAGSGFDVGRDWVWWQMIHDRGYFFEGAQNWDNRLQMLQCDNQTLSASNGMVNIIWIGYPF